MMPKLIPSQLLLLVLLCSTSAFKVSRISTLTSTIPGSGMDSGGFFSFLSKGGEFSVQLCSGTDRQPSCCWTEVLDNDDNNWELGQVDTFLGRRQLGTCFGFEIQDTLRLTLRHRGNNAGRLTWVQVAPWHRALAWHCPVDVDLDHSSSHTTDCVLKEQTRPGRWCNGATEFCNLRVDQFLWPGTHNAGTGQSQGSASCAFKNQEHDVATQLELGIRMLDVDTIFTNQISGCYGLETGHGSSPELGLYQCFGSVHHLLNQVADWLNRHPTELVVLSFGNIEYPEVTIAKLLEALRSVFPEAGDLVKINKDFKANGSWPLLGEAVDKNERVFVFIRDTVGVIGEDDLHFVREIKVKSDRAFPANKSETEVFVTSSYKARHVTDCSYLLETSRLTCHSETLRPTDFLKLSLFSKFGKGGPLGLHCVSDMAKKCNQWAEGSIASCRRKPFRPSMVLVDFPTYVGQAKSLIDLAEAENLKRAEHVLRNRTNGV